MKDKDGNGVRDSTDAILRYIAGYILIITAAVGSITQTIDPKVAITFGIAGATLVGEEKVGNVLVGIKR